ncbi:Cytochrome c-type biogenesis protein CcmG/DsbE, thiol:disulfide oxidoreductase [hydrothermal vent metagenome]|uniref:Cytochrome c-type biogenesis protein CcmG/DsbE, thiol:disulfide oxidoreductase n=1 Tax=hydrothermal vent metagenome TaxID=652676 RepID=A0A3B0RSB6_9ZZZZ
MTEEQTEAEEEPRRSIWFALLPVTLFGALVLVFFIGLTQGDTFKKLPSVLIGKPAPTLDMEPVENLVINGKQVPSFKGEELRDGKVTVVNFWASWCVPCRQEHPQMITLGKMPGIKLFGINYKNDPADAAQFLRQLGSPYAAIGSDFRGRAGIEWGVVGLPETYIVDGKGVIRYKFIGPISKRALEEGFMPKLREIMEATAQ